MKTSAVPLLPLIVAHTVQSIRSINYTEDDKHSEHATECNDRRITSIYSHDPHAHGDKDKDKVQQVEQLASAVVGNKYYSGLKLIIHQ